MSQIPVATVPSWTTKLQSIVSTDIVRWLFVFLLMFAAGQADRLFVHQRNTIPTLLFGPGCLLPVFLWWNNRYWTAAFCGAIASMMFLPNVRATKDFLSSQAMVVLAAGFVLEIWLTNWLLQLWKFRIELSRRKDPLLLMLAALIGTSVSGGITMPIVLWWEPFTTWKFFQTYGTWWLMHLASIVVITPAWLAVRHRTRSRISDAWFLTMFSVIILPCMGMGFEIWRPLLGFPNPLIYLGVPLMILTPLVCGPRGAALVTVLTTLTAGWATSIGLGLFDDADPMDANLGLNLFLTSLAVTTYAVGSFVTERREVMDRLAVGHSLLEKAEQIAGVGSWQIHPHLLTEKWSDQFYRILGLAPNEIPASIKVFQEQFVIDEDRDWFIKIWNSFIHEENPDKLVVRIRRVDGQIRIISAQADIQRNAEGKPIRFVGAIRDITQRRRAMEERERMQDMLNKAEEIAHFGSWEIDGNGFMVRWSDNMYRICGIERGTFSGSFESFLHRFVHPEDRSKMASAFQYFVHGAEPAPIEFRLVRNDGQVRLAEVQVQAEQRENGRLVSSYGTIADITERKQFEIQLKESESRYRTLADHCSDMIVRLQEDGTITYVSPACRKILGYEPEELLGRPGLEAIWPADQERCREMLFGLLEGEERLSVPYRGFKKDDSEVWLETKAQLMIDPAGRRELLCVTRDITERRVLEAQVAQAQRLEAIGRLAGGIAHDFNNILTVINGYAEILETRFPANDPATKYVANVLEAGRRAAQLTRQLLTYSRKQLITHGQIDLNEVIHKMEPLLHPLMGEEIEPVYRLDPNIGLIDGDVSQFEQLLMNLAINARDAMPEGGFLTIQTEQAVFQQWDIRPPQLSPGRHVRLVVADTGHGMDEMVRERVFEPFFTTKRVGEGTGLGLATVYATVEQSGGSISVESTLGVGTRFELLFPCRDSMVEKLDAAKAAAPLQIPAISRKILVVEDDPNVRDLVEQALQNAGYEVQTASEGESAIHIAASADPGFDLLLTDVVMKGLNGRELADRIRERSPHLPVIFMSGHTDDSVLRRGVLNDELTFLQKPFTSSQLLQRIHQVFTEQSS